MRCWPPKHVLQIQRCLEYAIWGENCSKCSTQKSHILLDLGMLSATSAHCSLCGNGCNLLTFSLLTFIKGFHTAWSWKLVRSCCTDLDKLCKHLQRIIKISFKRSCNFYFSNILIGVLQLLIYTSSMSTDTVNSATSDDTSWTFQASFSV